MNSAYKNLKKIIQERRSVFPASYTEKKLKKQTIKKVLESANYAPTHKLTEPWRFIVIRKDGLAKLADEFCRLHKMEVGTAKFSQKKCDSFHEKFGKAGCVIAINLHISGKIAEWEELAAVACAVQNMGLVAHSLDVGTYWSSTSLINQLGDFLGLAENEKCIGLFYMGYHDTKIAAANRSPITEKVRWLED